MSVAELAPQIQTPDAEEIQPTEPIVAVEPVAEPETEAQEQAAQNDQEAAARRVRKLEDRVEKLGKKKEFYGLVGEATLKVARGEEATAPKAASRWQRHQAVKAAKRVEKVQKIQSVQKNLDNLFGANAGGEVSKLRTFAKRHSARKEAKDRFKSGETDVFTYRKEKADAKNEVHWTGVHTQNKATKKLNRAEDRLDWNASKPLTSGIRDYRIRKAERELGRLRPRTSTEVNAEEQLNLGETDEPTVAVAPVEAPAPTEATPAPKSQADINREKLKQALEAAGVIATETTAPVEAETTAAYDVETTAKNILEEAQQLFDLQDEANPTKLSKQDIIFDLMQKSLTDETGELDPDFDAKGEELLEATQKIERDEAASKAAEATKVVATKAKEIFDSVEDKARAKVDAAKVADPANFNAKSAWAVARRQVKEEALEAIDPELRGEVKAAIKALDDEAFKVREARRKAKAAPKAAEPKQPPQKQETVQQRAKREREEKLAQKREEDAALYRMGKDQGNE